jgi:GNAT superfamily N-acetyltransferase
MLSSDSGRLIKRKVRTPYQVFAEPIVADIRYKTDTRITPAEFIDVLRRSTLADRRPVEDRECIALMLQHADLLVTAWLGETLVGVARSVTDFGYCCYLSDLAVDASLQRSGIGRQLVRLTKEQLGPKCNLILLSAPGASSYYAHIGFERHPSAWVLHARQNV